MFNFLKKEPQKLCKDCKWFIERSISDYSRFFYCTSPQIVTINIITGEKNKHFCIVERGNCGSCGPKGNFFEPKEEV